MPDKNHSPGPLTVFRRAAMASDFEISLNEEDSDLFAESALNALDEVDRLEEMLTYFRSSSWISRINALASEMNVKVPEELFQYLKECKDLFRETEGAFDIACTPLWDLWGFARHERNIPTDREIQETLEKCGSDHLILKEEDLSVAFDREGLRINMGGIGKGIALDRASCIMDRDDAKNYLLQGGKSSAIARGGRKNDWIRSDHFGSKGSDALKRICWSIGIADPLHPDQRLGELALQDRALSTSGSQFQFFRYKGKRYAHILDPRTGQPVSGIHSTIVLAPTARLADALSTAFYVLGPDRTEDYCRNHSDTSAVFLLESKKAPYIEIKTVNIDL
ncbi:MAG: FAD:protein FMN transferase [Planctomycetia bacterium]|nr:FAD:protein FMN transferase [Planctomycetia bacterium]